MDDDKKAPGDEPGAGNNIHLSDTTTLAQRQRILDHLQKVGPLTTLEARECLNIMHPGGRIAELRRKGHKIPKIWCIDHSVGGFPHRVARYFLEALAAKGAAQ